MSRVVLHLGMHKTATGTLQRQLFPKTQGLELFTTLDDDCREFIEMVTRKDPLYFNAGDAQALLRPRMSETNVNLISNESLSGPPYAGAIEGGLDHRSPILLNLKATYPDASVVLVIRRQDKLAASFYRQYLKSGGTRNVMRFFGKEPGKAPVFSLDRFEFSPYLRQLKELFNGRLLIMPFESFVSDQSAFLKELAGFLDVEFPAITLERENSTRLGPTGMEISRLLNSLFRNLLNPGGLLPGVPVKRFGKYRQTSPVQLMHDHAPKSRAPKGEGVIHTVCREIFLSVIEDNRLIADEFDLELERFGYFG